MNRELLHDAQHLSCCGSHLMPKVSYMPYTMTEDHVSAFLIPVRVMFVLSHIIIAAGEDKSIIHGRIIS